MGNILIIDDDPTIRRLVDITMSGVGYKVIGTENAEEALRLLDATPFKVIICDVYMR